MALVLDATYFTSSPITGTTASLAIQVPSTDKRILVIAVATDYVGGLGINATSVKFGNYDFGGSIVSSTGVAIYWLRNPGHTPGISTQNITITYGSSRITAICAYLFSTVTTSFPFGGTGLDGNVTGEPQFSGNFSLTDEQVLISCVKIEQNTLSPSQVTEVMNVSSGAGASLITYASGYYQASGSESVNGGWVRTGTPVDDTWGLCARVVLATGTYGPRVVNS